MHSKKLKKRKFVLFIIISWLLARLEWTIELSRLAIFRILPKAQIHTVSRIAANLSFSYWTYNSERLSCMNFDSEREVFLIYELPPISKN